VNTAISQEITATESGDKFTLIAVDAGGIQTMHLAVSLAEALEKFEELRKAGLSQIFRQKAEVTVTTAARRISRAPRPAPPRQIMVTHETAPVQFCSPIRQGWVVIRRGAATSAVKAIAEFGQDNPETDGNEVDTNILVTLVECPPVCLRKFDGAGHSTFRAF